MKKTKAPRRDYNADLRFDPAPPDSTKEELIERADRLIKAMVSGGAPRQAPEQEKPKP